MNDYFDFEDRRENDDTYRRLEERSCYSLNDAVEYDFEFINMILNKDIITEEDKYNIASVCGGYMYQLLDTTKTTKSFEDFTIEVMGQEWFNNMSGKWLARKSRELAKHFGMPEMADNRNIIMFNPGDKE